MSGGWGECLLPDIGVPLHIQVVEVVCTLRPAEVGPLQPLDDLSFHHPGDVSRQQREQQALLRGSGGGREEWRESWHARKKRKPTNNRNSKQPTMPRSRVSVEKGNAKQER